MQYIVGDATRPVAEGPRVLVHICNDAGGWGAGFVVAVSKRWQEPERRYRAWHRGEDDLPFALGQVQFVVVEPGMWVANLIGQHGIRCHDGMPPIRYDAVREGLARVTAFAREHHASAHMPRIGCGLAGGEWSEVSRIIEEELASKGISVTVYDLEPPVESQA